MKGRRLWAGAFTLYGAVMLWLLFHRAGYVEGIPYIRQLKMNLIPFQTIRLFWQLLGSPRYRLQAIVNLGGNVVMFFPLGFLLPRVFPPLDRLWKTLLATALIITAVELTQLFTLLGSCDTDDLILNTLGAAVGYGLHRLFPGASEA